MSLASASDCDSPCVRDEFRRCSVSATERSEYAAVLDYVKVVSATTGQYV